MRPSESFLNQPVRSLQEMLRVISLSDDKLPKIIPDGIYGTSTINAVNRFQQLYSLPISGISDQITWEKIVEVYELAKIESEPAEQIEILIKRGETLDQGDSGSYVYFLQTMLLELSNEYPSINPPKINGIYDNLTAESIRQFQKLINIPETGVTDKQTWKNIEKQFTLLIHHNNALKNLK